MQFVAFILPQKARYVVICFDGCALEYLDVTISEGLMPKLARIELQGTSHVAHSVISSVKNPYNMWIATGRRPVHHGICGNFLYDPDTGDEVTTNYVRFLRTSKMFKYYEAGARIALVTAKDKLRASLRIGLSLNENRAICFSSARADQATKLAKCIENASHWLERDVPKI